MYCVVTIQLSLRATALSHHFSFQGLADDLTYLNLSEYFYQACIVSLKISIGFFFYRLVVVPWQKYLILATASLSTVVGIAAFFFAVFQCGIYQNALDFMNRTLAGKCVDIQATLGVNYMAAAVTILTDWIFLILPIAILKGVCMRRRDKYLVLTILMFASVSGVAAAIRLQYIHRMSTGSSTSFQAVGKGLATWSCIEPGIGICAGCLITMRPLLRCFFGRETAHDVDSPREPQQKRKMPKLFNEPSTTTNTNSSDAWTKSQDVEVSVQEMQQKSMAVVEDELVNGSHLGSWNDDNTGQEFVTAPKRVASLGRKSIRREGRPADTQSPSLPLGMYSVRSHLGNSSDSLA